MAPSATVAAPPPPADLDLARAARAACRSGTHATPTAGVALGHVQANLVVLPKNLAFDFLLFCQRNPRPCPVLDVTDPGDPEPCAFAPGADLRTDLPRYRVYRKGRLEDEPTEITGLWRDDFVGFLLGCSFTFENAMLAAGLPVRQIEEGVNVPMYRTDRPCVPAGAFSGPLVVSMRPIPESRVAEVVEITGRYPRAHGAPVHAGDPAALGIADLDQPDFGDPVTVRSGEVPVFWACGVTPQAAIMAVAPEIAITHAPGHMFVGDWTDQDLRG